MSCLSFFERPVHPVRLLVLLGGLLAGVVPAFAAPSAILPFGAETWSELGRSPGRPMAVVFTTTDCGHCPKVIDGLADDIRKARSKVRLVVVVMDGAGQEDALRADRHYRHANTLYAFDGDPAALRYKVNPAWHGMTPYVAFMAAEGAARFHLGAPPPAAVRDFLRP
jgi:hypothetical protein